MAPFDRFMANQPSIAWRNPSIRRGYARSNTTHPAYGVTLELVAGEATILVHEMASPEEKMAALRAVLFLAKEPLSGRKLSQYSNLADGTEARTLVTRLNRQLDENGRAFRV